MVTIRDTIFINQLEKRIGRKLNEEENEKSFFGEPFDVRLPNGNYEYVSVPLIPFPNALLPDYALNVINYPIQNNSEITEDEMGIDGTFKKAV